jgi:hypothetical protein
MTSFKMCVLKFSVIRVMQSLVKVILKRNRSVTDLH